MVMNYSSRFLGSDNEWFRDYSVAGYWNHHTDIRIVQLWSLGSLMSFSAICKQFTSESDFIAIFKSRGEATRRWKISSILEIPSLTVVAILHQKEWIPSCLQFLWEITWVGKVWVHPRLVRHARRGECNPETAETKARSLGVYLALRVLQVSRVLMYFASSFIEYFSSR